MQYLQAVYEYFFSGWLGQVELIASVCTLICVYQCAKENIWNFFWGGIAVLLFGFIFFEVKLYADMLLQWGYYLPITFFGWYIWYNKEGTFLVKDILTPTYLTWEGRAFSVAGIGASTLGCGFLFSEFTDAALPYPDSFILGTSIVAQYLLSLKKVESWILWVAVNTVAVPVYAAKELYVVSGLYVILWFLAIYGLIAWVVSAREERLVKFGRQIA